MKRSGNFIPSCNSEGINPEVEEEIIISSFVTSAIIFKDSLLDQEKKAKVQNYHTAKSKIKMVLKICGMTSGFSLCNSSSTRRDSAKANLEMR